MRRVCNIFILLTLSIIKLTGQEETNYKYDLMYISEGDEITKMDLKAVKVKLYLDDIAFKEVSKIKVSQKNLTGFSSMTSRTIDFNFQDRINGWEDIFDRRYGKVNTPEKLKLLNQVKTKDKVTIDQELYQVEIDLGTIHEDNTEHEVIIRLEYKNQTTSSPLEKRKEIIIEK